MQERLSATTLGQYVLEQLSRMNEIVGDAGLFRDNFKELNDIISNLNGQCDKYKKSAKAAITKEIFEVVTAALDFNFLYDKLKKDIASKQPISFSVTIPPLPKLKSLPIEIIDDDILSVAYEKLDDGKLQMYADLISEFKEQFEQLKYSLDAFNNECCAYREATIRILQDYVSKLYLAHYSYVANTRIRKQETNILVKYGTKTIPMNKHQKEFVISAIKIMLNLE